MVLLISRDLNHNLLAFSVLINPVDPIEELWSEPETRLGVGIINLSHVARVALELVVENKQCQVNPSVVEAITHGSVLIKSQH